MTKILLILLLISSQFAFLQEKDTVKVVSYNLLNFPELAPERIDTLKTIMAHLKPDILMVCELTSGAGANAILFDALNEDGESDYDMADYVPGPDTENELYFNSTKLGLSEQNVISTPLRDINEYVLYYKSLDIATTTDTTFFYVYVCHLKASSGFETQRNIEATALKTYLSARINAENIIIGGDFNFYGSDTEPGWNTILHGGSVEMKDPLVLPGYWHGDPGFAWAHTQSTRSVSFNGGSTGGMDDRFDFIFIGEDLKSVSNEAQYINGSYRAVGQDGLHFNQPLNVPANLSEPAAIISSLYYMSDHLPVYLEISVLKESANVNEVAPLNVDVFYDAIQDGLVIHTDVASLTIQPEDELFIYSLTGQLVFSARWSETSQFLSTKFLSQGVYILKLSNLEGYAFKFAKS